MTPRKLQILHLEDLPSDAELVRRALVKAGLDFDLLLTDNRAGFLHALDHFHPDIILSDHSLPSFDSIEALSIVRSKHITIPFILITATISEEFAVEVMKEGAWDYILKDRLQRLPNAIKNALEKHSVESERRKVLDQIIANESLFKEAERVARFGTWRSDLVTGITVMSDAAYRILGYEPGEMDPSANAFLDSIHPDDLLRVQTMIGESLYGSDVTEMEFRMTAKDKKIRHVRSQFRIDRDPQGTAVSIVGFNQDITQKKEADLRLLESEVKYRHLFENNPMPMWVLDTENFSFLDVNIAALLHYGYSRQEFLSMNALQLRPLEERERFIYFDRTGDRAGSNTGVWTHLKKDGTPIQVEIYAHPIYYDGKKAGLILANDVTEIGKARDKLNQSLRDLEAAHKTQKVILDALPANIALLDSHGIIRSVNNGWKIFAKGNNLHSKKYCVGDNYIDVSESASVQDQDYGRNISRGIQDVIHGRAPRYSMEYPCHGPHLQRWFRVEIAALHDHDEAGAVVMHIDITDRKLAELAANELTQTLEKKVSERTAQLEQSMKELESFSYSVSHDLRAPLRVITGYSKLFMDEYMDKLDQDAIEYIQVVNDNAMQMGQLIEDLLNLSRLGLESVEKEKVDMKTLVGVTVQEYRHSTTTPFPDMIIDTLPSALCSHNLIRQVWINLISNAIKYSAKSQHPAIHIGSYMREGEIVYFIKDNGAGFDMKYAHRLFGVFQRLHNRQDFEGTGVGLALVHRIITRHGGQVWAEAQVDAGATFYFSLPI